MTNSIYEIGNQLVEESSYHEAKALSLSTSLIPFLIIASRKMSTRAVSSALKAKGVTLSATSVAKALRKRQTHLEELAAHIDGHCFAISNHGGPDRASLLYGGKDNVLPGEEEMMDPTIVEHIVAQNSPYQECPTVVTDALNVICEIWEPLPEEAKSMIQDIWSASEKNED